MELEEVFLSIRIDLSKPLPVCEFRWLNDEEISKIDVEKKEEMDDYGYILEVDLGKLHSLSLLHSSAHTSHIFNNFKSYQSIIISNLATTNIILIVVNILFIFLIGYPDFYFIFIYFLLGLKFTHFK